MSTAIEHVDRPKSSRGAPKKETLEDVYKAADRCKYVVMQSVRSDDCCRIVFSTPVLARNFFLNATVSNDGRKSIEEAFASSFHSRDPKKTIDEMKLKCRLVPFPRVFWDTQFDCVKFLVSCIEYENLNVVDERGNHPIITAAIMVHRGRSATEYKLMLNALEELIESTNKKSLDRFPLSVVTDDCLSLRSSLARSSLTSSSSHFLCGVHLRSTLIRNFERFKISKENRNLLCLACFGRDEYGKGSLLNGANEQEAREILDEWLAKSNDTSNMSRNFWSWLVY